MGEHPDPHGELPLDPDPPLPAVHLRLSSVALVFVGGALGTWLRYTLSLAWSTGTAHWPWGTFVANLAGAFVLGVLLERLVRSGPDAGLRQRLRLLVGTGFCGGLTTYSTLAVESDLLVRSDATGTAIGYLAATLVAGAALTWTGNRIGGGTMSWVAVALVGAGGAGAGVRLVVDGAIRARWPSRFPWATFVINVSGSLALGVLTGIVLYHHSGADLRLIAGTGFCGGYTTFGTASFETVRLAQQRRLLAAGGYAVGTAAVTVAAASLGLIIAR